MISLGPSPRGEGVGDEALIEEAMGLSLLSNWYNSIIKRAGVLKTLALYFMRTYA